MSGGQLENMMSPIDEMEYAGSKVGLIKEIFFGVNIYQYVVNEVDNCLN